MRFPLILGVLFVMTALSVAVADDGLPKAATGRVVDEQGKPIQNIRVSFDRAKKDQPPRRRGQGAIWHALGRDTTDIMGGFTIRFDTSVATQGRLRLSAGQRDYESVGEFRDLHDAENITITMKLLPRVALARAIRDEDDPERAVARAVELLRYKPKNTTIPDSRVIELFPYLVDIRAPLLAIADSGEWEEPIEGEAESVGYRARLYLAHAGDPRDEAVLGRWWKEWQATGSGKSLTKSTTWRGSTAFLPDKIQADTIKGVVEQLRSFVEMHERARHYVKCETEDRALVRFYYTPIRSWQYCFEAVLVRRNDQWRVLFYRPTNTMHINFGF